MAMTCPSCGGSLVELERSGVHIDACRNCRGVWLDRGELERIVERERERAGADDEDDFLREMTGKGAPSSDAPGKRYGLDAKTAERLYSDYRAHKSHKKPKKSFLEQLLD
jgi:Zn-finger nucleic acid-binding protein